MGKYYIADVCDVFFRRVSDGKLVFTAEAQLASVKQNVKEEKVKGGIGNKDLYVLRSEKEIELQVRNAVFDSTWLEMACGLEYADDTKTIYRSEKGLILAGGKVTIKGTPKNGDVILMSANGTQYEGTLAGQEVSIVGGTDGDLYVAVYQEDVAGKVLSIDGTKFAEKFYVEYQTIEYDLETNEIVKELIWQFDSVSPNSSFDLSFENGKAQTPDFTFTATAPIGSNEIGRVVELDVA